MPKISKEKIEKIKEQILNLLFNSFPKSFFTSDISKEIARDEEFTKNILLELEKKGLVFKISKNKEGLNYTRRIRWRISSKSYDAFKKIIETKRVLQEKSETNSLDNL